MPFASDLTAAVLLDGCQLARHDAGSISRYFKCLIGDVRYVRGVGGQIHIPDSNFSGRWCRLIHEDAPPEEAETLNRKLLQIRKYGIPPAMSSAFRLRAFLEYANDECWWQDGPTRSIEQEAGVRDGELMGELACTSHS